MTRSDHGTHRTPEHALADGTLLPRLVTPPPGPRSRELSSRLGRVESRNVTHLGTDFPIFWEAARGANVQDADGNVYLDLTGAFGVAAAGHSHPRITAAIRNGAGRLVHGMGDVHPPTAKVELLERLAALAPWPETRGVLASSGSEAVEIALKTALLATGRPGVLAFTGGYHGLTAGSLAVTSREDFRRPFRSRLYGGVAWAPFPGGREGEEDGAGALTSVRKILADGAQGDPVGAVVVEPIQGRGGVRVPPPGFLRGVAEAAREAGAVVIFDEIFTGFGRTGTLFAFQSEGVAPDLLCLGKALGGGLPLSVCLGDRAIMDAWPPSPGEALHTSTFLGHPLACMAALAFLDVLEEEGLVERSRRLGMRLRARLREGLGTARPEGTVRGRGLFVGIDAADPAESGGGARIMLHALRQGVLLLPAGPQGEVVELSPPLTLTDEQLDAGAAVLLELLGE